MHFELTILGSNGAIPAYDRHPTSQIVNYNSNLFMVDCGEGTQFRMNKFNIKRGKLDHIFISHLHGDHFFGLMGLITSFNLNWREHALNIYGPPALHDIINLHLKNSQTQLKFDIHFHPIIADKPHLIYEDHGLTVETIVLKHRLPTTGFLFREKPGLRKIRSEKLSTYDIPVEFIPYIKKGDDFITADGQLVPNSELTIAPHAPRSYAYCSDTAYHEPIIEQLQGVNLLYHEATFVTEHEARAAETFHSTGKQAALIAKKAGAHKLVIGHFSARYENLNPLLEEARAEFADTELAIEGQTFSIQQAQLRPVS